MRVSSSELVAILDFGERDFGERFFGDSSIYFTNQRPEKRRKRERKRKKEKQKERKKETNAYEKAFCFLA